MGQYLASPITDKDTVEGSGDLLSYGVSAHQGWRKNMEDAHLAAQLGHEIYLFGIFDGHGGPEVAKFCSMYLREEVEEDGEYKSGKYGASLTHAFHRMDDRMRSPEGFAQLEAIRRSLEKTAISESEGEEGNDTYSMLLRLVNLQRAQNSSAAGASGEGEGETPISLEPKVQAGCTAVTALVVGRHIYVANAGDSRAVLSRRKRALPLSQDHKPSAAAERARIVAAGGFLSEVGGITRVNGNLNLSRAIGDLRYKMNTHLEAKDQIITAEPDIVAEELRPGDRFVVMACDGIWDVMSSQQVVDFVNERLDKGMPPAAIASELLNACVATDPRETRGIGCDNMTATIIVFKQLDEMP